MTHRRRSIKMMNRLFILGIMITMLLIASASRADSRLSVTLVPTDGEKMVFVPIVGVDDSWRSDADFVDTAWTPCIGPPGGVGFDFDGDYNKDITLDVGRQMRATTSCFIRYKFNLSGDLLREFDYLALRIRYDDGFIAYLNGVEAARAYAPNNPGRYSRATQPHEAQSFLTFDISQHVDALKPGDNVLAIHGMNVSGDSPDFLIVAELVARKNYQNNFESNLPVVVIQTQDNRPVNQTDEIPAAMGVIARPEGNNRLTSPYNDFDGDIAIRKEKSFYNYTKSSYRFTITDEASLLGMPPGDAWRLTGPYSDKTLVRNVVMGIMAHKMGHLSAAPKLCHLFLNDAYRGVYVLMEQRTRGRNRIDVSEASTDDASGGYILNMTGERWLPGVTSAYPPFRGSDELVKYQFFYPPAEEMSEAQTTYINDFMQNFERAVKDGDMALAFNTYIDLSSFVDYFILNEAAKNINAYRSRAVLYKDRDAVDGRLCIDPLPDFEDAVGNVDYYDGWDISGWALDYLTSAQEAKKDTLQPPFWWPVLREQSDFKKGVYKRWNALYDLLFSEEAVAAMLDSLYAVLTNERDLNFDIWNVIGQNIEPNDYVGDTYDDDFDNMLLWLLDRLDWMNAEIASYKTGVDRKTAQPLDFSLQQNYPNPFNPATRISYDLRQSGFVTLDIYNLRGEQVARLISAQQSAGHYTVDWDAAGFPSGVYFYVLQNGSQRMIRRMLLLR